MSSPAIKVLIVDDDEDDYQLLRYNLKDVNYVKYDISWCYSYEDALDALRSTEYDVATIDYQLGAKNGLT